MILKAFSKRVFLDSKRSNSVNILWDHQLMAQSPKKISNALARDWISKANYIKTLKLLCRFQLDPSSAKSCQLHHLLS